MKIHEIYEKLFNKKKNPIEKLIGKNNQIIITF